MTSANLQGASRESLAAARETLGTLIRSGDSDLLALGDDLFAVAAVLDREVSLRRALTDPSRSGDDRAGLARAVFGEQVGSAAVDVVVWAVRSRWSAPRDLVDAVELLAVEAVDSLRGEGPPARRRRGRAVPVRPHRGRRPRAAHRAGRPSPHRSRTARLSSRACSATRSADETRRLVRQAVVAPRGRTFDRAVERLRPGGRRPAQPAGRHGHGAVPLTEEQRSRLAAALRPHLRPEIHLNVEVDPELVGGIRVEIGDEVIDGTVVARLDEARRRLVG